MRELNCRFDRYFRGSYQELFDSFEYEILLQVDDEFYAGDSRILFRDGDHYGILIFGWGSCPGCDALEGCNTLQEVYELRDQLHQEIVWGTLAETRRYLNGRDWPLQYSWHHRETREFLARADRMLMTLEQ